MKQFAVPQFIDVEPKVIGPITVRQFVMLIAGGLFIFIAYKLSSFVVFIIWAIVIAGITVTFAFAKINSRPFHLFLLAVFATFLKPNLRVWDKDLAAIPMAIESAPVPQVAPPAPALFAPKLRDLALVVDTGGVYSGDVADAR